MYKYSLQVTGLAHELCESAKILIPKAISQVLFLIYLIIRTELPQSLARAVTDVIALLNTWGPDMPASIFPTLKCMVNGHSNERTLMCMHDYI